MRCVSTRNIGEQLAVGPFNCQRRAQNSGSITSIRNAPFSKRHVASLLGVRPEMLSRCLRLLEEAGVITKGRVLRVLDATRLEELARGAT